MQWLVSIVKLALPFLVTVRQALASFDNNVEGWDDELASKLDDVIAALSAIVSNAPQAPARGLAEILAYGKNIITALESLIATADMPQSEKIEQGSALVASLSDSTKVYQAKRGKDAEALAEFKVKAQDLLDAIMAQG